MKDYAQPILLDSSYRDRARYPLPSEFTSVIKAPNIRNPTDPVGIGYVIYQDTGANSFRPGDATGSYGYVPLSTGISPNFAEDNLLNKYINIIDPPTLTLKGIATVQGFVAPATATGSITGLFASNYLNMSTGDLVYVRQLSNVPALRFAAGAAYATGSTQLKIVGGSATDAAYVGYYLTDVTTSTPGYYITAYTGSTQLAQVMGVSNNISSTDVIELYQVRDNEIGMSHPGAMAAKTAMVNHSIFLEWIRIPRHPLFVDELGVPTGPISLPKFVNDFAYLLVKFKNKNDGSYGIIQSNTEVARGIQFVIPVEDLSTDAGKYFTFHGAHKITAKFNPSEAIEFGVYLPNGQPLRFDPADETAASLVLPNQDLQISALFTIKRKIEHS